MSMEEYNGKQSFNKSSWLVSVNWQTNDSHIDLFIHSIHKETSLKVHHALIRISFMLLSVSKI